MFVAYNLEGENKGPGFNLKGFVDDNSCPTTIAQVYAFFLIIKILWNSHRQMSSDQNPPVTFH